MAVFAQNSKNLKKLSYSSCTFGAKGTNAMLNYCASLEKLSVKWLKGINNGGEPISPRNAVLSLKSIFLKELVNSQCFEPLVIELKKLKTLKIIKCLDDWDKVLETINGNNFLIKVHLERIQVSNIGLTTIAILDLFVWLRITSNRGSLMLMDGGLIGLEIKV